MTASFTELGLSQELLKAVEDLGFEEPSPIQVLAIPALLTGKDAVGQAQTGTGKTAAFGLPILEKIASGKSVQALVLCPTRELAIQVSEELSKLAVHKRGVSVLPIYGGQPIERQLRALAKGAQVVVGTPGRVIDHLQRGTLRLNEARIVVLDEADEMLDMGFREDIELILEQSPADCQRVLFSATMPQPIRELSKRFLREPEMLTIAHKMLTVPAIEQVYYEVRPYQKMDALCRVLDSQGFRKALVFCATKRSVDEITVHLQQRGYQADGLHGDMNQTQRDRVMSRFRTDGIEILVATDVAARGIDVDDVDAVFNYDVPEENEYYIHRIGRTARAAATGSAVTFVSEDEQGKFHAIEKFIERDIRKAELPASVGAGPVYNPAVNNGRGRGGRGGGRGRGGSNGGSRGRGRADKGERAGRERRNDRERGAAAAENPGIAVPQAAPADNDHASGRGEGNRGTRDRKHRHRGGRNRRRGDKPQGGETPQPGGSVPRE